MAVIDTFTASSGAATASSNTLVLTVPRAVPAGTSIILATSRSDTGQAVGLTSIVDSRGNTWVKGDAVSLKANNEQVALSHSHITVGLQAGDTITVTWAASAARRAMAAHVVNGLQTVAAEATSGTTVTAGADSGPVGSSTAPTATTGATTTAQCLVVAAVGVTNPAAAPLTPGAGYTAGASVATSVGTSDRALLTEYKTTTTAGAQTAAGTLAVSTLWAEAVAAYPLAATTGGGTVAYVGSAQGTNNTNTPDVTATMPAAAQAGHLALAVFTDGAGSSITPSLTSAGWTPVTSRVLTTVLGLRVWSKTLTAADLGSTVTVTAADITASEKRTLDLLVYSGAVVGNAQSQDSSANPASNAHTAPAVTVVNGNATLVNVFMDRGSPASTSISVPSNLVVRQSFPHTGGAAVTTVVADDATVGAGAQGANTGTGTLVTTAAAQATIVLEPGTPTSSTGPTANAGTSLTNVEPGSKVTVGGTDTAPAGVATILWTQTAGAPAVLSSTSGTSIDVTVPATMGGTTITLQKTVTDTAGASDDDFVSVQVLAASERVEVGGAWAPSLMSLISSDTTGGGGGGTPTPPPPPAPAPGITLSLTVEPGSNPPRIRIDVTDTSTTPVSQVTVTRRNPDGHTYPVRTADGGPLPLSDGQATIYDYEAPYGAPITFSTDVKGAPTATAVLPVDDVWLIHTGVPSRSCLIKVTALPPGVRPTSASPHKVLGAKFPVPISSGARQAKATVMGLRTFTEAQERALDQLCDDDTVLLLNIPPSKPWGWDPCYVSVGDLTPARTVAYGRDPKREWQLPIQVVGRPGGGTQAAITWADVAAQYQSWQAIVDAGITSWAELAAPTT